MNWEEFVNSEYNDGNFYLHGDNIVYYSLIFFDENNEQINKNSIIKDGESYHRTGETPDW